MRSAIAPIAALLFSVAILLTGNGLLGTLLPLRAQIEAFSTLEIGILGSAYFLGFAFGCLLTPFLIRRVGHIRSFTAMVCIAASAALTHALVPTPAVWWTLRAVYGFCFAALFTVIESWLNERSTNANRGIIFSVYTIISLSVLTVGQLMIMLYDPSGFPLFCIVGIFIALAAVPVALTTAPAPAPVASVRFRLKGIYDASPVGFVGCLAAGLANSSFWALGPVFAQRSGLGISGVAYFMSATVIAGAVGLAPLGLISDRVDRRKIIACACAGASIASAAMVVAGKQLGLGILFFSVFFGLFAFSLYAISVAHANDSVAPENVVETAVGLLLTNSLGAVIGPLLASAAMIALGEKGLFAYIAVIHGSMAIFAFFRTRLREPVPTEDRTKFAEAILTAQTVAPLDLAVKPEDDVIIN